MPDKGSGMDTKEKMLTHLRYWLWSASVDQIQSASWYYDAHFFLKKMAERYNERHDVTCAITAVLSPMTKWEQNIKGTEIILSTGKDDGVPGFSRNREKALKIYYTKDVSLVSGIKVRPFYETLLNPWATTEITVDNWMLNAAGIPKEWGNSPTKKEVAAVQEAVNSLAEEFKLQNTAAQAIVWSAIRDNGKGGSYKPISKAIGTVSL